MPGTPVPVLSNSQNSINFNKGTTKIQKFQILKCTTKTNVTCLGQQDDISNFWLAGKVSTMNGDFFPKSVTKNFVESKLLAVMKVF